jgi:hypothetical protein
MSEVQPVIAEETPLIQAEASQVASQVEEPTTIPAYFPSMAAFKEASPKVYNAMMDGIARTICSQSRRQNESLIRTMKEARRNNK